MHVVSKSRKRYFTGKKCLLLDQSFDAVEAEVEPQVGYISGKKCRLPKALDTLKKKNDEDSFLKWMREGETLMSSGSESMRSSDLIVMDKIDGIHCLLHYTKNSLVPVAYTRGNGLFGKDISRFNVASPQLVVEHNTFIEGELVIDECDFQLHFPNISTARQAVTAIFAKNSPPETMKYVKFIAYSFECEGTPNIKMFDQLTILERLGFSVCPFEKRSLLSWKDALNWIESASSSRPYIIDGIVVDKHLRGKVAIKPLFEKLCEKTVVTHIVWKESKSWQQIPTIHFNPIRFGSVVVKQCTGFNRDYVINNGIGPGAEILIQYQHCIPLLFCVTKRSTETLDIPECISENVYAKKLLYFFKTLEISNIGEAYSKKVARMCLSKLPVVEPKFEEATVFKILMSLSVFDFQQHLRSRGKMLHEELHDGIRRRYSGKELACRFLTAVQAFGPNIGLIQVGQKIAENSKFSRDLLELYGLDD